MYWDVVEVKPEQGYRLFVRFEDGLSGRVRLTKEELTGALAPLLEEDFFKLVYIDEGAVAWPGEIDLAPDAMYDDLAAQRRSALSARDAGILEYALDHLDKERQEIQAKIDLIRRQLRSNGSGNSSAARRAARRRGAGRGKSHVGVGTGRRQAPQTL